MHNRYIGKQFLEQPFNTKEIKGVLRTCALRDRSEMAPRPIKYNSL